MVGRLMQQRVRGRRNVKLEGTKVRTFCLDVVQGAVEALGGPKQQIRWTC